MKVLLGIPHIFDPKEGSVYSSQNEEKRSIKIKGLQRASTGNIRRFSEDAWVHASENNHIVTKRFKARQYIELHIEIYSINGKSLTQYLDSHERVKINYLDNIDPLKIPWITAKNVIEKYKDYDMVGYIEDDISIEDQYFFEKLEIIYKKLPIEYNLMPHRCEQIDGKGEVILSGDPVEDRPDLFWDTKEKIGIDWPTGIKVFYRATNPHSGCFFLHKLQAEKVYRYWSERNWKSNFKLSGPLEQAATGVLLPAVKIMKPEIEDYRFLKIRHNDQLWKRHEFEDIKE